MQKLLSGEGYLHHLKIERAIAVIGTNSHNYSNWLQRQTLSWFRWLFSPNFKKITAGVDVFTHQDLSIINCPDHSDIKMWTIGYYLANVVIFTMDDECDILKAMSKLVGIKFAGNKPVLIIAEGTSDLLNDSRPEMASTISKINELFSCVLFGNINPEIDAEPTGGMPDLVKQLCLLELNGTDAETNTLCNYLYSYCIPICQEMRRRILATDASGTARDDEILDEIYTTLNNYWAGYSEVYSCVPDKIRNRLWYSGMYDVYGAIQRLLSSSEDKFETRALVKCMQLDCVVFTVIDGRPRLENSSRFLEISPCLTEYNILNKDALNSYIVGNDICSYYENSITPKIREFIEIVLREVENYKIAKKKIIDSVMNEGGTRIEMDQRITRLSMPDVKVITLHLVNMYITITSLGATKFSVHDEMYTRAFDI